VTDTATTLPGFDVAAPPAGDLETHVQKQITKLQALGYIEDHHAGLVQLALVTARDIDRSFGKGAPSGRANLLRVMNEVLSTLPQPEAASRDSLEQVVAALRSDTDDEAGE
jgi:hypothetical protein